MWPLSGHSPTPDTLSPVHVDRHDISFYAEGSRENLAEFVSTMWFTTIKNELYTELFCSQQEKDDLRNRFAAVKSLGGPQKAWQKFYKSFQTLEVSTQQVLRNALSGQEHLRRGHVRLVLPFDTTTFRCGMEYHIATPYNHRGQSCCVVTVSGMWSGPLSTDRNIAYEEEPPLADPLVKCSLGYVPYSPETPLNVFSPKKRFCLDVLNMSMLPLNIAEDKTRYNLFTQLRLHKTDAPEVFVDTQNTFILLASRFFMWGHSKPTQDLGSYLWSPLGPIPYKGTTKTAARALLEGGPEGLRTILHGTALSPKGSRVRIQDFVWGNPVLSSAITHNRLLAGFDPTR